MPKMRGGGGRDCPLCAKRWEGKCPPLIILQEGKCPNPAKNRGGGGGWESSYLPDLSGGWGDVQGAHPGPPSQHTRALEMSHHVYIYRNCITSNIHTTLYGPAVAKRDIRTYANNEAPDKPPHPRSLVRIFVFRIHQCVDEQRRPRSDSTDAQVDLDFRFWHLK